MSGTGDQPGGLGSRGGGGGDFVKPSSYAPAAPPSVTNQQILPLPAGLDKAVPSASERVVSMIQLDFAIDVSKALTRAYERVRDELTISSDCSPAEAIVN